MERVCVALMFVALTGCQSIAVGYGQRTTVQSNPVANLWLDDGYRYVKTGLQASAHAPSDSADARSLAGRVMDRLVETAGLGPNQVLVDVTVETGTVDHDGIVDRVVTLRGDVIEFVARGASPSAAPSVAPTGATP